LDQGQQLADVIAGGQFRDDAAIFGVHLDLAEQPMGEQASLTVEYGGSGLVAGCFYAQYFHGMPDLQVACPVPTSGGNRNFQR
jgi:hypothetical protein